MSMGYTLNVTFFAAPAPMISTWLVASTGNPLSPVFYVIFISVLSLVAVYYAKNVQFEHQIKP